MRKAKIRRIERIEHYLVRIIQQPGADQGHPWPIRLLLAALKGVSLVFRHVVLTRLFLYNVGICRRYPLGCQVISVGNITAGGTGKTPVVEIFARELQKSGRKVAILSRGYKKEMPPLMERLVGKLLLQEGRMPPRAIARTIIPSSRHAPEGRMPPAELGHP